MSLGAGQREYMTITYGDITTGAAVYIVMPERCLVTKIWGANGSTATGVNTVTCSIGGTGITGGVLVCATDAAAGEVDAATPTALNEVAAGGTVGITFDGTPTGGTTYTVTLEVTKGLH